MADDLVSRDQVLAVLRASGVTVVQSSDGTTFTLSKAGTSPEAHVLPEAVGRRLLHRFARRFGINVHIFWHPELLSADAALPN